MLHTQCLHVSVLLFVAQHQNEQASKFYSAKNRLSDRGQGLNHCICDSSHILEAIQRVRNNETTFKDAISAYDEEVVPRGSEEVKCSVENGLMLHDWEKVKESPVFQNGFKPMTGHDGKEPLTEHAAHQQKLEDEARKMHIAAH